MDAFVILFTVILLASANGVLGTFLVLRKSVMIGDAISHAVLPGLIIGFLISGSKNSFPMLISAAISGVLTTLLIQYLNRKSNLPKDASIGFVFTTLFAIGIIMVSVYADNIDIDADCVLHGELGFIALEQNLTIGEMELFPLSSLNALVTLIIVLLFTILFKRQIFVTTFDPQYANTIGMNPIKWDNALMALTSLVTVVSFEAVGAILVIAFLVLPVAAAYLLTTKLNNMMILSVVFSMMACVIGYYLSQVLNTSISSAIVTSMGVLFCLSFIFVLLNKRRVTYEGS
jgi:manganese/zinc/iron transport system permease protein